MRGPLLPSALLLAGLAPPAPAAPPADRVFVEVAAERDRCFVHEVLRLRLRVGVEETFLGEGLVPLLTRPLDLPVRVEAPFWDDLPGTLPAGEGPDRAGPRVTLAVNGSEGRARPAGEEVRGGRRFRVVELERSLLPVAEGELVIPAPSLRFAFATEFGEDALGRTVPVDRREAVVEGEALRLRILPLPEEGRPPGFSGAVGRFTVRASSDAAEVAAGESLRLSLRVEGEGSLAAVAAPRLEGLPGFHVYGHLEEAGPGFRTFVYDIAPLHAGVAAVPSLPFPFFDPGPPAAWRVARTEPIPLVVRPAAGAAAPPGPAPRGPVPWWRRAAVFLGVLLAAVVVGTAIRRGRVPARTPAEGPSAALARLSTALDGPGADPGRAYAAFLAACLRVPPAAVVDPGLEARLAAAGVPAGEAGSAADLLHRLVAARFGGAPAEGAAGEVRERAAAVAAALEGRS